MHWLAPTKLFKGLLIRRVEKLGCSNTWLYVWRAAGYVHDV